jgi:hypothetical protein
MAGDWIKMRVDISDDPAVIGMSVAMEISEDEVVGKLHRLWSWADKHTIDGKAPAITAKWVDRFLNKLGFAESMQKVGWLRFDETGIVFPQFSKHNGESAKKRAGATSRQRSVRENTAKSTNVTEMSRNVCDISVTKAPPEKRREDMNTDMGVEKKTPSIVKAQPKTEFPEELDTPEFRASWTEWIQHRIELKKPMKPTSAKTLLKTLAKAGEQKAIESITHSIANGWQGVFEPSAGAVGKRGDMFSGIRSFMENTDEQGRFFTGADDAGSDNGSQGPSRASVRVVQNLLGSDAAAVGNWDQ